MDVRFRISDLSIINVGISTSKDRSQEEEKMDAVYVDG